MANDTTISGTYPCYENQFQFGVDKTNLQNIADMESFSVSIDNGIEEWNPYENKGWVSRLMTAKSISISVTGKRNVGDAGNDAIASMFMKNGRDAQGHFQWTFPDGATVLFENAVVSVTNIGAGDSTGVAPLEFEIMSNGKPTYTPAA